MAAPILAIDDDRAVLHLIEQSLQPLELPVIKASSADEGLEQILQPRPDVLLLDIKLPGVSGLDLLEKIQQIDRKLPVIFITADTDGATTIEAMRRGGYDYVPKPLDLPALLSVVKKALATRQLMNVPVALPTGEDQES